MDSDEKWEYECPQFVDFNKIDSFSPGVEAYFDKVNDEDSSIFREMRRTSLRLASKTDDTVDDGDSSIFSKAQRTSVQLANKANDTVDDGDSSIFSKAQRTSLRLANKVNDTVDDGDSLIFSKAQRTSLRLANKVNGFTAKIIGNSTNVIGSEKTSGSTNPAAGSANSCGSSDGTVDSVEFTVFHNAANVIASEVPDKKENDKKPELKARPIFKFVAKFNANPSVPIKNDKNKGFQKDTKDNSKLVAFPRRSSVSKSKQNTLGTRRTSVRSSKYKGKSVAVLKPITKVEFKPPVNNPQQQHRQPASSSQQSRQPASSNQQFRQPASSNQQSRQPAWSNQQSRQPALSNQQSRQRQPAAVLATSHIRRTQTRPTTPQCLKRSIIKASTKIVKSSEQLQLEQIAKMQKKLQTHLNINKATMKKVRCPALKPLPEKKVKEAPQSKPVQKFNQIKNGKGKNDNKFRKPAFTARAKSEISFASRANANKTMDSNTMSNPLRLRDRSILNKSVATASLATVSTSATKPNKSMNSSTVHYTSNIKDESSLYKNTATCRTVGSSLLPKLNRSVSHITTPYSLRLKNEQPQVGKSTAKIEESQTTSSFSFPKENLSAVCMTPHVAGVRDTPVVEPSKNGSKLHMSASRANLSLKSLTHCHSGVMFIPKQTQKTVVSLKKKPLSVADENDLKNAKTPRKKNESLKLQRKSMFQRPVSSTWRNTSISGPFRDKTNSMSTTEYPKRTGLKRLSAEHVTRIKSDKRMKNN